MRCRWVAEEDVSPARALATGAMLGEATAESDAPVVLYGATLSGDPAVVLGRWQRPEQALDLEAIQAKGVPVLRRETGGPACVAGAGIAYVALCLRNASALIECPPDRVLNRNVRGVLGGLAKGGVPAHYFGREWVSWDRRASGAVVLEFFVGVNRGFALPPAYDGYPSREEEPFLGKTPTTLKESWEEIPKGRDLIRMIAEGHTDRFEEVELEHSSLSDAERAEAGKRAEERRVSASAGDVAEGWVKPQPIPIGFVSARLQRDETGVVSDVEIAGDFFQDRIAPDLLREKLVGSEMETKNLKAVASGIWDGSRCVLEGVKGLDPIAAVLMAAAEKNE